MFRNNNTNKSGVKWSKNQIDAVWNKGKIKTGYPSNQSRLDACGATINYSEYGELSQFGWEIDHIIPVAHGGLDNLSNLQPLQWMNNRRKGDNIHLDCAVTY